MPSERDTYFFDLNGYIVVRGALSPQEVRECNECLDAIPPLRPGQWYGGVHGHTYNAKDGLNYQQVYEAGEPFEKLIDHPSWIDHMLTFLGGQGTFDLRFGPAFIDECFANFRDQGEAIGMHSGGELALKRNQYRVHNGKFMVNQINSLVALKDIGPGDGATMVIPGSHKQNFIHPDMDEHRMKPTGGSGDNLEGAVEVHLKAGDALIFTDAICHGSARRTNPGQRRIVVYRYMPAWSFFRHGYRPTRELLARLTPRRRQMVWPHQSFERTPNLKEGFTDTQIVDPPPIKATGLGG